MKDFGIDQINRKVMGGDLLWAAYEQLDYSSRRYEMLYREYMGEKV